MGDVLAWVACLRGWRGWCVQRGWGEWRATVDGMLLLLLLLLLKYYPEEKNFKCLLLKQKIKKCSKYT